VSCLCSISCTFRGDDLPEFYIPTPKHEAGEVHSCLVTSEVEPDEVNVTPDEYMPALEPVSGGHVEADGDIEPVVNGSGASSGRRPTAYEINGIRIDVPWALDLACDSTPLLLKDYSLHLRNEALKPWLASTDEETRDNLPPHLTPVMYDYGITACCDGSPSYSLIKQRDANPAGFKHFHNESGPFHAFMKAINCRGLLLGEPLVADLLGRYRKSERSVDYVLFPSDPSQFEPEHIEAILVIQLQCARRAASMKANHAVSSVDAVDVTIARSQEEPLFFLVLIDLRLADILWLIRDTERTGEDGCDPELYRMGAKYTVVLYAATGAYKYVRIFAEFFKDRLCESELDKAIYDAFVFAQDTVNGKKIWTDESVEWMMKDVRSWMGKHYLKNHEALLNRVALTLVDMKGARVDGIGKSRVKQEESDKKSLMVTRVFLSTMVWAYDLNLVGPGPIKYHNGETSKGYQGPFFDPSGEVELNWGLLNWYQDGIDSFKAYMKEYYVDGELHQVSRPNRIVSLRRIPTRRDMLTKQQDDAEAFFSSMDPEVLSGDFFNKDDLIDQLRKENQLLPEETRLKLPAKSKNKKVQGKALSLVRLAAREKQIDLSSVQSFDVVDSEPPSREKVTELLSDEFYSLTSAVREKYSTRTFTLSITQGEEQESSTSTRPGSSGGVSLGSSVQLSGALSLTQSSTRST
jgi:hypothetical protein